MMPFYLVSWFHPEKKMETCGLLFFGPWKGVGCKGCTLFCNECLSSWTPSKRAAIHILAEVVYQRKLSNG